VDPLAVERTVIPHDECLTHAKVVIASATGVDDSVVLTSTGRAVAYDFLVIGTGRTGSTCSTRTGAGSSSPGP
jgi:apoptosis-inducing factor 2